MHAGLYGVCDGFKTECTNIYNISWTKTDIRNFLRKSGWIDFSHTFNKELSYGAFRNVYTPWM